MREGVGEHSAEIFDRIVDEVARRLQAGEPLDVDKLIADCPEFRERLHRLMPGLQMLVGLGSTDESAAGSFHPSMHDPANSERGVLGDFQLIREIGRGGMGVVYEAEQMSLGRRVALKLLPFTGMLDTRQLQRFKNEARAAASLHHNHIVPVFAIGCERGFHFYAMQYIEGRTLAEMIGEIAPSSFSQSECSGHETSLGTSALDGNSAADGRSRNPLMTDTAKASLSSTKISRTDRAHHQFVAQIGVQLADALEYAHSLGIIHRDIKPSNVILDAHGNAWVTDFGLAQMETDVALTMSGDILGTLRYMSPEQAQSQHRNIDGRSDIYSLGITLYELLTLRPAFAAHSRRDLIVKVVTEDPIAPRALLPQIPRDLETILIKCFQKDPRSRYSTARELATDLQRFLNKEPIVARRPSLGERTMRWMRRNSGWAAALVTAASISLVMLLIGALGLARSARITANQRLKLNQQISDTLLQLERSRNESDEAAFAKAREYAGRAVALADNDLADPELRARANAFLNQLNRDHADRHLLNQIELARTKALEIDPIEARLQFEPTIPILEHAFSEWGIKLLTTRPVDAAAAVQRCEADTRSGIVAGLDYWMVLESTRGGTWKSTPRVTWLQQLLSRCDPDPWRKQVRTALIAGDFGSLAQLAQTLDETERPTSTLHIVGQQLCTERQFSERGVLVLRDAWEQAPSDFWINYQLFYELSHQNQPDYQEALRFASIAAAVRPDSAVAQELLAMAYANVRRDDEAIEAHLKSVRLKPDYADAYNNLGNVYYRRNELDKAVDAFREAIKIYPEFPQAHNNLALAMMSKGDVTQGIELLHKAIRFNPQYYSAYKNLGQMLEMQGDIEGALEYFRKAATIEPIRASALVQLSETLQKNGCLEESHQAAQQAIEVDPHDASAHMTLALILQSAGDRAAARKHFELAIQLNPHLVNAHYNFGNFLLVENDVAGAKAEFLKAIEANPNMAEAHCNLGAMLQREGQFAKALEHFRQGHELGSRDPSWPYPSGEWVKQCEALVELEPRVQSFLSGTTEPADNHERVLAARFCAFKADYQNSVRFYEAAFERDPQIAEDLATSERYNAACAAILAALECQQNGSMDMQQCDHFRSLAHAWLSADLEARKQHANSQPVGNRQATIETLRYWLQDGDLASIRELSWLEQLPSEQRATWQKFWADHQAVIAQLSDS